MSYTDFPNEPIEKNLNRDTVIRQAKATGKTDRLKDMLGAITGSRGNMEVYINLENPDEWHIIAMPERPGVTGERAFYVDQTGVIRYTTDGTVPNKNSPPLDH
jgi:hypothetical protein